MVPVLLFCPAHFAIIRDQQRKFLDPEELITATPPGNYDLQAFLKTLPSTRQEPSCLVSFFDGDCSSLPQNVAAVACPKALVIGDTHHVKNGLLSAIKYALAERYDLVIGQFARQHLHFFHEAGIAGVTWIPCFSINPFEVPAGPTVAKSLFVGQVRYHPYRKHILARLKQSGLAFDWQVMPPAQAAQAYSATLINLNISLNGDFNLRNLEILAASGFLMAERLSPESGMEILFQDRRHLVLFDSADHARELVAYYLVHPQDAQAIAVAGHAEYLRRHRSEEKIRQFYAALRGTPDAEYRLDLDARTRIPAEPLPRLLGRIELYQSLQELHRNNLGLRVLFWRGLHREAIDAVDLPRVRASVLTGPGAPAEEVATCGLSARIERLAGTAADIGQRQWDVLCAPVEALDDPLLHTLLTGRRVQTLFVAHAGTDDPGGKLQHLAQQFKLRQQPGIEPPFFSFLEPGAAGQ